MTALHAVVDARAVALHLLLVTPREAAIGSDDRDERERSHRPEK